MGFSPTIPLALAGLRTDPPVSVPSASGKKPAASPAPEPEEEPPGWWSVFHGLRAGGNGRSKLGPPMANSWVDSLPITMAPAWRSLPTTTASAAAILSTRIFEWLVVGRPATSMMSLIPTGTPCSGPRMRPAAISASALRAMVMAASASRRMKAFTRLSSLPIRSSSAVISSTGDRVLAAKARAASDAVSQCSWLTWVWFTGRPPPSSAARVRRRGRWDIR